MTSPTPVDQANDKAISQANWSLDNPDLVANIDQSISQAQTAIESANNPDDLNAIQAAWFGQQGSAKDLYALLKAATSEQKKLLGKVINQALSQLKQAIKAKLESFEAPKAQAASADFTLPAVGFRAGSIHPTSRMIQTITDWFLVHGYQIDSGVEVENDWNNFGALNIPENHPARTMHDTFYLTDGRLLRTHTSTAQVNAMNQGEPPLYIASPGRVYRRDSDPTHTPVFHQVEALVIDKNIGFPELKSTLKALLSHLFGSDIKARFRPSFFPFTEPSAEVDISCFKCAGSGCRLCSQTGWIEVLGAGLVHPNVLKNNGIDSEQWQGFAFGLGVERLAMLLYGIDDLRLNFESDLRFLEQFA